MAGLISTGIWGFICSAIGRRDAAGELVMEEHFLSGFAGWGWKIWRTVAGFFRLEIDELVVRRTMTVFELLIQKVRAVKGAMAITQASGKINTVQLSDDESTYLITLEEEDMSFVEHDFLRCQEFSGNQTFYHVEIESVENGIIRVPVHEFEGMSVPTPGDEIIQFGNSSRNEKYAGRHSAIYLHADESGQPAIDVLFDIYSKDWTGCVKVRVGGEIPDSGGLKGFFCENGMIKCTNKNGIAYCLHPDGTAEFGSGAALFRPDNSGYVAGGAIAWAWSAAKGKYVCSMQDVVITWDSLSDEAKENLKGETGATGGIGPEGLPGRDGVDGAAGLNGTDGVDGVDANLLPWIESWNGYATEMGDDYIVTPKMFSGTRSAQGKLTGIAQGRECITINGVKRTGIFAVVDDEVVFELDPLTKRYLFKGRIEADEGMFSGSINTPYVFIDQSDAENISESKPGFNANNRANYLLGNSLNVICGGSTVTLPDAPEYNGKHVSIVTHYPGVTTRVDFYVYVVVANNGFFGGVSKIVDTDIKRAHRISFFDGMLNLRAVLDTSTNKVRWFIDTIPQEAQFIYES